MLRNPLVLGGTLFLLLFVLLLAQITQPLFSGRGAPPPGAVDPEALERQVRELTERYFPRDAAHPQMLARVADFLEAEFAATGAELQRQSYSVEGEIYHNVIAGYGPETKERIIVAAHYDTAGPQPGADDNASGVAGLLALAPLLAEARLPLRTELVAYTLEEPPHFRSERMGSAVHARSLSEAGVEVRTMLCLEMIGYFDDAPGSQHYPLPGMRWLYSDRGDFIAVVGRFLDGAEVRFVKQAMRGATELPVYSLNAPAFVPGVDLSDHSNFWLEGYPAVMITDTAFYRNPGYHNSRDTPDRLDYPRMAEVVKGVYATVLALAAK